MSSTSTSFPKIAGRFLPLWFFVFLFKFGAGIHYSLITVLGAQILPLWIVGLCVGGASFIQLLLDVPAGFMLERYGHLRMLRFSTVCFLLAGGSLVLGLSPATYIATVVFSALGWLFFGPGIAAYLLTHGPVATMGRLTALRRMCEAVGITCALLGLEHFSALPVTLIGLVIIYPFLGALAALIIAQRHPVPTVLHKEARNRRIVATTPGRTIYTIARQLHPVGTVLAVHTFAASVFYSMIWFLFPLIIIQSSTPGILSVALASLDLTVLVVDMPIGTLVDRYSKRPLVVLGMVVMAVAAITLSQTMTILVVLLAILLSLGDEIAIIALWAWLDQRTSKVHHEGIVAGTLTFVEDIGWSTGPVLAGILAGILTASATLLVGSIILASGAVFSIIMLFGTKARLGGHRH